MSKNLKVEKNKLINIEDYVDKLKNQKKQTEEKYEKDKKLVESNKKEFTKLELKQTLNKLNTELETKKEEINKEIQKKKQEYYFDKNTDIVPKKTNRLLVIMLSEDKGLEFLYRKFDDKKPVFRFNKGKYIIENEGVYSTRNGCRVAIYIEGISVPIKASYIEKKVKDVSYLDVYGNEIIEQVDIIEGIRFDSKIFDTFSNREFAEVFTKEPKKTFEYLLLILVIINMVLTGVAMGLIYYYRGV